MASFDLAIPVVLQHEGGWVDDPADAGGETNFGWSMLTVKRLGLTPADLGIENFNPGCLKNLTKAKAADLYRKHFWDVGPYDRILDQKVATKLFDFAVNAGPGHMATVAQRAAVASGKNVQIDGVLGPASLAAINSVFPPTYVAALAQAMGDYYRALVVIRPADAKFLSNWLHRSAWGV